MEGVVAAATVAGCVGCGASGCAWLCTNGSLLCKGCSSLKEMWDDHIRDKKIKANKKTVQDIVRRVRFVFAYIQMLLYGVHIDHNTNDPQKDAKGNPIFKETPCKIGEIGLVPMFNNAIKRVNKQISAVEGDIVDLCKRVSTLEKEQKKLVRKQQKQEKINMGVRLAHRDLYHLIQMNTIRHHCPDMFKGVKNALNAGPNTGIDMLLKKDKKRDLTHKLMTKNQLRQHPDIDTVLQSSIKNREKLWYTD